MPTSKPRVAVTLDYEAYELISRFADLQGKSKARVCADMLEGVAPFMRTPIELLERSKTAPTDFKMEVLSMFEQLEKDMLGAMSEALQADMFKKKH